ncbi:MAG: lysyl oxidase family protein [Chitinophagales bacterium]
MIRSLFFSALTFCGLWVKAQCPTGYANLEIKIVPDNYPAETHWSVRNAQTGALIDTGNVIGDTLCVPTTACMVFTIFDDFGDGICCTYGSGSYQVKYAGNVIATGGSFQHFDRVYFNCPQGTDCSNTLSAIEGVQVAPFRDAWYYFITDSAGMWEFSTCSLGNACDTRLYIYDRCHGATIDDSNMGTMYFSDNSNTCSDSTQAVITAALPAHDTLFIRVGDAGTSCSSIIAWRIRYNGPIRGCMDPAACNYNPNATVSDTSCIYPPNAICHAPDLEVVGPDISNTIHLDSINYATGCYVPEGCLQGYGMRYILRFDTHIKNVGDQDYFIGVPSASNPQFTWDPCHGHWHYVGYAEYLVFNALNQQMQVGYKNGFCVLDLECSGGGTAKFGCSNMGITAGCGDIYNASLACQWVDITNLDTGQYTMVVRVNWDRSPDALGHYERSYFNNWAQLCFRLSRDAQGNRVFTKLTSCPLFTDCAGDTFGSHQYDCNHACGGTAIRGDLNTNAVSDSVDIDLYLQGLVDETIPYTPCNDLNGDSTITLTDAHRLNECRRYQNGTLVHVSPSHPHCDFPRNISNIYDTVTLSIGNINVSQQYFEVLVKNPHSRLLGYEFKIKGAAINHIQNLWPAFATDTRWSALGHIDGLARTELPLQRNTSALPFLRVYYDTLTDSNICISRIYALINENYEECVRKIGNGCFAHPMDTINLLDTIAVRVVQVDYDTTIYRQTKHVIVTWQGNTSNITNDTLVIHNTTVHADTTYYPVQQVHRDWTVVRHQPFWMISYLPSIQRVAIRDTVTVYDTVYAYAHDTVDCHHILQHQDSLKEHITITSWHHGSEVTVEVSRDSSWTLHTTSAVVNHYRIDFSLPVHPLVLRDTLQHCDTVHHVQITTIRDTTWATDTVYAGITSIGDKLGLKIVPNPNNGRFEIYLTEALKLQQVQLFSTLGQVVFIHGWSYRGARIAIDAGVLPEGIYTLRLNTNKGVITTQVMVQ